MDEERRQKKERSIWRKLAKSYDDNTLTAYQDAYRQSIDKVNALLKPGQQVLEIGCGTGIISLGIAPKAGRVVSTDITPEMIAIARAKAREMALDNVIFRVCDGYHQPDADESFDLVLLFNILHVVKYPSTLLAEAKRLLKPGGYLVTATDCGGEPVPGRERVAIFIQRLLKLLGLVPFMRFYRKEELHILIQEAGFNIVETNDLYPAPPNHYVLAEKP